jgi:hypothetical protein
MNQELYQAIKALQEHKDYKELEKDFLHALSIALPLQGGFDKLTEA